MPLVVVWWVLFFFKNSLCFWGQITHIRKKVDFFDVRTPFPRQGGPPEKKCHLESGLNQRDRATAGFVRVYTHRKPGKIFYWRGFTAGNAGSFGCGGNTRQSSASRARSDRSRSPKLIHWPMKRCHTCTNNLRPRPSNSVRRHVSVIRQAGGLMKWLEVELGTERQA